ncbi:hypothetical protein [Emticicia oligotrophica]|uniref:hypothetical protein n=1 Tax=Emticicia oligotrophica TaxID=312279 RepID=UPI00273AF8A5|nr:hypothetical protein [Emticicia oligotrophica]
MKNISKIVLKHQVKILLLVLFVSLLLNTYEMLFSLIKSEAIFNNGQPKEVGNTEGFLAIIAYCSLVGIAYCLFSAYQNNDFRRNKFPDMSFDRFKDEPQFELRDWTDFNKSCQIETERLKRILNKTEGEEKIGPTENTQKNRIGVILPSLHNSATLEVDEVMNLKNKINQTKQRRAKAENAFTL